MPLEALCATKPQQLVRHAGLKVHDRVTDGLGGVCRQNGTDPRPGKNPGRLFPVTPALFEALQGPAIGARNQGSVRSSRIPAFMDPEDLFRRIDQQEEEGERASNDLGLREGNPADRGEQFLNRGSVRPLVAAGPAGLAEVLDRLVAGLPLHAENDAAQGGGEPLHVFAEGTVLFILPEVRQETFSILHGRCLPWGALGQRLEFNPGASRRAARLRLCASADKGNQRPLRRKGAPTRL